ncbi:uncharacterized protein [Chironomus tepperi]|uniref:uncharacterized protein n=1 Tax=Chironomus tepperi TaxID=113505 RepID=UPI00391F69D3
MKPKSVFSLIFCITIAKIHAEQIDCNFEIDDIQLYDGFDCEHKNVPGYGCKIQNIELNDDGGSDIVVHGDHMDSQSDDDVTYIINEDEIDDYLASLSPVLCTKYPNLMMIHLRFFDIEKIEENSLENCQNLVILNLYGNNISEIPENLLSANHELTEVNIIHNAMTTLPEKLFENQAELQWLNLRVNKINFLPSKIFKPLQKLHILNLGANKLQNIDSAWFESLGYLKELYLDENQISQFNPDIFRPLQSLEGLDLGFNQFKSLRYDQFKHLKSLKSLSLGANELPDLPKKIFLPLRNLEKLWLYGNQLSIVSSEWFGVHSYLVKLDFFYNKISAVDQRLIDNSPIAEVDMEGNECNDQTFEDRDVMKANMTQCFENFKQQYSSSGRTTRRPYQVSSRLNTPRTAPVRTTRRNRIVTRPVTTQKPTIVSPELEKPVMNCGRSLTGIQNAIGGTKTPRGAYPWNVALLHKETTGQTQYFCGGSLVSNKTVVTAAHCILGKNNETDFKAHQIIVVVGVHDINDTNEIGRSNIAVKRIIIHRDWNPSAISFDADIAILELDQEIHFTNYIQPICLATPDLNNVTDGFVAGFGKSESGYVENIAKTIPVPIHDSKLCVESRDHAEIFSARSICGGSADGVGVCQGDSGSGLIIKHNGIYYLRGLVSASLHEPTYGCNVHAYSIFTDVTKFSVFVMTQKDSYTQLLEAQARIKKMEDELEILKQKELKKL